MVRREPLPAMDGSRAWVLDFRSDRPFHPVRLQERIELLGRGRRHSGGCFWLPSRPTQVCQWDGAGGMVSIGRTDQWEAGEPLTRIVVVGVDDERERVARAFESCLLTDAELAERGRYWEVGSDGLEPWLGPVDGVRARGGRDGRPQAPAVAQQHPAPALAVEGRAGRPGSDPPRGHRVPGAAPPRQGLPARAHRAWLTAAPITCPIPHHQTCPADPGRVAPKERTLNNRELVAAVATRTGLGLHAAQDAVSAVFDLIAAEVADGEQVTLHGFGTFTARERAASTGRNPRTGEPIEIPAGRSPGFKPSAVLRKRLSDAG